MSNQDSKPSIEETLRIKAVDSALEWNKQISTLATGTIILSGTFIKDLFNQDIGWKSLIIACWVAMGVAAVVGLFYQGAISSLLTKTTSISNLDIYAQPARLLATLQLFAFLIGLVAFTLFVALNL